MGLLLINKPLHWTSNDVVRKVKGILHCRKVGHAGTLDPLATGLLILGVDDATKELPNVLGMPKTYECIIQFGYQTSTDDLEGAVLATTTKFPSICSIVDTLECWTLRGYQQRPPSYSAIKKDGKPCYQRARAGEIVLLPPRDVKIYDYQLLSFEHNELRLRIVVSKGFYVRSLARDLGVETGSLATLAVLKRVAVGPYHLAEAREIEDLYDHRIEYKH